MPALGEPGTGLLKPPPAVVTASAPFENHTYT
jgi:hypothetical protein